MACYVFDPKPYFGLRYHKHTSINLGEHMEIDFTLKNIEIDVDYDSEKPPGFDYESRISSAPNLKYCSVIEVREWGIKDIASIVPDQSIEAQLELTDKNGNMFHEKFVIRLSSVECRGETQAGCPQFLTLVIRDIRKEGGQFVANASGELIF